MPKKSERNQANAKTQINFVDVALPIPLRKPFIYAVPPKFQSVIQIGARVQVPFGKRELIGYAIAFSDSPDEKLKLDPTSIKEIIDVVDHEPLLTEDVIELTRWTADYFFASWGEMLKAALPAGINSSFDSYFIITDEGLGEISGKIKRPTKKTEILEFLSENGETGFRKLKNLFGIQTAQRISLELLRLGFVSKIQKTSNPKTKTKTQKAARLTSVIAGVDRENELTEKQKLVLDYLINESEGVLLSLLQRETGIGVSPVKTLAKKGYLEIFEKESRRNPHLPAASEKPTAHRLTEDQREVLSKITRGINSKKYASFLLHGVTGSGKTEVYIRAMKATLDGDRSALMMVPEIALTPVFSKMLRSVFGDEVAILHSSLSSGDRFDEWRRIRNGKSRIVIGTRSAVFAPLQNLGLVVIDEEHDTSYRQHELPFYNARDVGIVRARLSGAAVILGSATPSLESFHNTQIGKHIYLNLSERIGNRPLAKAEIVDMRRVFAEKGSDPMLSSALVSAIQENDENGEQSIILLNRRGFSQFVLCRSCGEGIRCQNCDITLTFHKKENKLICHYCAHHENPPIKCPNCDGEFLFFVGTGTEQIEDLLRRKFSNIRIARIDRDTTKKKHELENTLSSFQKGEIDLLIGTQMIAKGHDFPNVTLVGVISVDAGLSMPDFRAAEKTFQLLTQVAGRAGRGKRLGRVLIQTFHPDHYAVEHAKTQSYEAFYEQEIVFRKNLHYPPFVALASFIIKHPKYDCAFENAQILRRALDKANDSNKCIILGPSPAPLARLKGEHRLQMLIKSRSRTDLRETLDFAMARAAKESCDMKTVFLEIDPVNLL